MSRRTGRALLLTLAVTLAACSSPQPVPLPPSDADPTEVVQAYVAAINARDRDTLAALTEDGEIPESWLGTRIDLVEVGAAQTRSTGRRTVAP